MCTIHVVEVLNSVHIRWVAVELGKGRENLVVNIDRYWDSARVIGLLVTTEISRPAVEA